MKCYSWFSMSLIFVITLLLSYSFSCKACPFIGNVENPTNLRTGDHRRNLQGGPYHPYPGGPPSPPSLSPGKPPTKVINPPIRSSAPKKPMSTLAPTAAPTSVPKTAPTSVPKTAPTSVPKTALTSGLITPSLCQKTNYSSIVPTTTGICAAYKNVLASFTALLPPVTTQRDTFKRSNILAKALRLAFHDVGEIDIRKTDSLGPDGCLSNSSHNAGLLSGTIVETLFEPIFQQNCNNISRADFWALLGWLAVKIGSDGKATIKYQYGKTDAVTCPETSSPRLPGGQLGHVQVSDYFQDQLGLTLRDEVTLLGAHTLGRVHQEFSNYTHPIPAPFPTPLEFNAWDSTPETFDNEYYKSMVLGWHNNALPQEKTIWTRGGPQTIMLNVDMVMGFGADAITTKGGQACGPTSGCTSPPENGRPDTVNIVQSYIDSDSYFLSNFTLSFQKLLSVGYGTGSSKLGGPLVDLDLTTC